MRYEERRGHGDGSQLLYRTAVRPFVGLVYVPQFVVGGAN